MANALAPPLVRAAQRMQNARALSGDFERADLAHAVCSEGRNASTSSRRKR